MNIIIIDGNELVHHKLEEYLSGQHCYNIVLSTANIEEVLNDLSSSYENLVIINSDVTGLLHPTAAKASKLPIEEIVEEIGVSPRHETLI